MIDVVSWVGIEGYQADGNEGLPEVNCVGADGIFDRVFRAVVVSVGR